MSDDQAKGLIEVVYDQVQHCTATKASAGKTVAMDCPYTGKGIELSPTNMVEAALGGCILMAMGAVAQRNEIDMQNARVEAKISPSGATPSRFGEVTVVVNMPKTYNDKDRIRLERAADACPIKHSFLKEIPVTVSFSYPE